jgi:hypothetical protein
MTLYELLFILLFLGSVIGISLAGIVWVKGAVPKRLLVALTSTWIIYFVILVVSDSFSSQELFKIGEEECFDEMCVSVVGVQTSPVQSSNSGPTTNNLYVVKVRLTSHSLGRTQAERGLRGRLFDGQTYFGVSQPAQMDYEAHHGTGPNLTQEIGPGESVFVVLVFDVPKQITQPALTLDHGFTPGYFVIGESPFFHKPDIHLLADGH